MPLLSQNANTQRQRFRIPGNELADAKSTVATRFAPIATGLGLAPQAASGNTRAAAGLSCLVAATFSASRA
jgi:hypothetical protein